MILAACLQERQIQSGRGKEEDSRPAEGKREVTTEEEPGGQSAYPARRKLNRGGHCNLKMYLQKRRAASPKGQPWHRRKQGLLGQECRLGVIKSL